MGHFAQPGTYNNNNKKISFGIHGERRAPAYERKRLMLRNEQGCQKEYLAVR